MAIGSFANLAPAQLAVAQRRAASGDLLGNILQSLQQGAALGNFPEQIQQDRLSQQLNNALLAQRLQDLQNPEQALARKIQQELTLKGALNPDLGIRAAEPGLLGQTIGTPSAIGQTEAELDAALALNPQMTIPTAAPGAPETPISVFGINTGLTSNPNIPRRAAELKTDEQIRLANARAAAQGQSIEYFQQVDGTVGIRPKKIFGGVAPVADTLKTATGEAAKEIPKPTKGSATGGLTANQQANLRLRGGRSFVDINQYTDPETGVVDWNMYATEVGKAEGNTLHANNLIKNARTAAAATKTTVDQKNFQLYGNRMDQANAVIDQLAQSGFDPTSLGTEGLIGSWVPNLLKTSDRQSYEQAERNFINAALRRESGAVITEAEFVNGRKQYFPQPGDGEQVLAQKAQNRKLVVDEFRRLGGQFGPEGAPSSPVATPGINPAAPAPVTPASIRQKYGF